MPEGQTLREVEPTIPLADAVSAIFERRAKHGDRELIMETYTQKFEKLLETLPKENRDNLAIKIQKFFVKVDGWFAEYGARVADFVRNVTVWPMIRAQDDFPNDVNYQAGLARAQSWGEFALRTTKTATAARMAYRDNFFPSALTVGTIGAIGAGVAEGVTYGALAGLHGAAIGAVVGGAVGGGLSLMLQLKDRIMGPPVLYFGLGGPASGAGGGMATAAGSALARGF